jgi:hypothetical protein
MLAAMLQNHSHRTLADFNRKRGISLLHHDLTLLKSFGLRETRAGSEQRSATESSLSWRLDLEAVAKVALSGRLDKIDARRILAPNCATL